MTQHDDKAHTGKLLRSKNGFNVISCERCKFPHVAPVPTADELANVYRHDYYATEKPLYIQRYREDHAWWDLVNDDRLDDLAVAARIETGRVLDVGSGPGLFLERAQGRGFSVLGIEPSSQAAADSRARGIPIVEDFLDERTAPGLGVFDCVHSAAVFEHLPDPGGMLDILHGLLRPGGALIIVVPNDENPIQHAAIATQGLDPWWIAPPHHLNYFNTVTLPPFIAARGFRVVDTQTSFPIDQFLLMGDRYIGDDALGRTVHKRRMAFELAMRDAGQNAARRAMQRTQASAGIGREVIVVAVRDDG